MNLTGMISDKYILTGVSNDTCPTRIMLSVIEGKWKMLLLYHLFNGSKRAGEFERLIPDAKRQVLSQHLRELEQDGLIRKQIYPQVPLKVEYHLTTVGESLEPVFRLMYEWGLQYASRPIRPLGHNPFTTTCIERPGATTNSLDDQTANPPLT